MSRHLGRRAAFYILTALAVIAGREPARAVPSFAAQTGQPCNSCHIGSFGPQLTPFGRAFKIGGYTMAGGKGWLSKIPLAGMILSSFTHTNKSQPEDAAPHFGRNDNVALDQVSLFLAGRVNEHAGMFVQGTYDGVGRSYSLDNTDLRLTTPFDVRGSELRIGLSVNNGPTVQDPYNSTFAWIFPFASSALAPTPTAAPLLAGGLIGNSLGATVNAWYNNSLYFEAGAYGTYSRTLLRLTNTTLGPGETESIAPYARVAYEWNWGGNSAHLGGLFLHADLEPATGDRSATEAFGRDHYTDVAVDAGYQFLGNGTHIATADAIFTHEAQSLRGSLGMGASSRAANHLNQGLLNLSYWYRNTYGANVGWQHTWGNANPGLYAPDPVDGSNNGKPDSNDFILEADWVPFGKEDSWARPLANLKLGAQYTIFTQFNGGSRNYDGSGRDASDNDTLFLFAWLAF